MVTKLISETLRLHVNLTARDKAWRGSRTNALYIKAECLQRQSNVSEPESLAWPVAPS